MTAPARAAPLTVDCLETCEQFHQQTHAHLADRETVLLDMIELLRTTVATISRGALGYEQQIDASTERLTHAARLDHLRELKCAIQEEVESIRRITNERRDREAGAFKRLTDRVAVLEAQLTEDQGATDPLTGIPNRGAFERTLRRHLRDAQAGQSFVLALVDLDDFKHINDTHGLLVGDRALLCVAQHLTAALHPDDVARFGEDEFAVLMADVSLNQARKRLAEARNRLAQSYRYEIEGKSVQIGFTYSGGMTEYSAGDDADTILRRADEALDDAKRRRTTPIVTRRRSMLRELLRRSKD